MKILCLIRDRERFIKPLINHSEFEIIVDREWDAKIVNEVKPDLVLSVGESHYGVFNCFVRAKELNIPTLNIQDGIHEWRDIWENKKYSAGGRYFNRQFIIADKIMCMGQLQADWFTASGMTGQPEIIGIPWLDDFIRKGEIWRRRKGIRKVLIMTANTPAFDDNQYSEVLNSMLDLKDFFKDKPEYNVVWRVRGRLNEDLNLSTNSSNSKTLHEEFIDTDIVLSTPSTAIIEAMIAGIPSAIIDYTQSPHYILSAWKIFSQDQISTVITDISRADENKLLFQKMCLNLMVYTKTNATERMISLIKNMIINKDCNFVKTEKQNDNVRKIETAFKNIDFKQVFPKYSFFSENDVVALQVKYLNLLMEAEALKSRFYFLYKLRSIAYKVKVMLSKKAK